MKKSLEKNIHRISLGRNSTNFQINAIYQLKSNILILFYKQRFISNTKTSWTVAYKTE